MEPVLKFGHLAGAEERAGVDAGQADNFGALHVKFGQGGGKGNRLGKPVFGQAARAGGFQRRMQDIGARGSHGGIAQALALARAEKIVLVLGIARDQSSPS